MNLKQNKGFSEWIRQEADDKAHLEKVWNAAGDYKADFHPDSEQAFRKFQNRLQADAGGTAGKVVALPARRQWLRIAAAVAVLAVAAFGVKNLLIEGPVTIKSVATAAGQQSKTLLADGTLVRLNEKSSLEFPSSFDQTERRVSLRGEAFFDVAKDAARPFIIESGEAEVQVVGTSFNVRSYPDEDNLEVFVKTGIVTVLLKNADKKVVLKPGDKLIFDQKKRKTVTTSDTAGIPMAWTEGVLNFKETSLEDIFEGMKRLYHLQIEMPAKEIYTCRHTLTLEAGKLDEALQVLALTCPALHIARPNPGHIVLKGSCCN